MAIKPVRIIKQAKFGKADFTVINGERVYVGFDRRLDRRRGLGHERVESLLKNFGLDRRLSTDRRRKDTSWFLTSKKVVNG
ncbi:MAG: hypothetical protein COA86_12605 [Kangiella sp.]|nr:MAG: hypothetical protein COA86_12605 [Kangiella sp.]